MTEVKKKTQGLGHGSGTRLSFDKVKQEVEDTGCKLISTVYKRTTDKIDYECKCGSETSKTFNAFRTSPYCKECVKEAKSKISRKPQKKYTIEIAREIFDEGGCKLLSVEYKNASSKLKYICECGEEREIALYRFIEGRRCKECGIKNRVNPQKYSIEDVQRMFEENKCTLLSTEYKNNKTPLTFKCKCGETGEKVLSEFLYYPHCSDCGRELTAQSRRYNLKEVEEFFSSRGCLLLDSDYKNNRSMLKYLCKCGTESETTLDHFLSRVHDCFDCYSENQIKYTIEYMKELVEEQGFTYLNQDIEHRDARVSFICSCGRKGDAKIRSIILGATCRGCYKDNRVEAYSGEKNTNWNPYLTDEDRQDRRLYLEYTDWRRDVYSRDRFTCQCCGQLRGKINAHHKDSYHWSKERRVDTSNGVTLCESCHVLGEYSFHRLYGNKNNTEKQYDEWIDTYQSIIVSSNERRIS